MAGLGPRPDPRAQQRQQALAVLAALDAGPASKLTFGGRFKQGGDPLEGLRAYYPSVEIARQLVAQAPSLREGVRRALQHYRIPDDRRSQLIEATALPPPLPPAPLGLAEPAGELGTVQVTSRVAWNALLAEARAGNVKSPLEAFAFDDATVTRIFQKWRGEGLPQFNSPTQPGEVDLALIRVYARGIELGVAPHEEDTPSFKSLFQLAITPERAGIARRLLETRERWVEENDLHVAGVHLSFARWVFDFDLPRKSAHSVPDLAADWPPFLARLARGRPEPFPLAKAPVQGRRASTPAQTLAAFHARDPKALAVDDASLMAALKATPEPAAWLGGLANPTKDEWLRLLQFYERGTEQGLTCARPFERVLRTSPYREDPDVLRALARVICQENLRDRLKRPEGGDHLTLARGTASSLGVDENQHGHWLHRIDCFVSGHQVWVPARRPLPGLDRNGKVIAPETPEIIEARAEALYAGLEPIVAGSAPKVWAEALLQLLDGPLPNRHEFSELLEALKLFALNGRLPRLSLDRLPEALGDRLLAAVADYAHPFAVAALGGLLLEFPAERLARALTDAGAGPAFAKKFAQSAVDLGRLNPEELAEVLNLPKGEHGELPTREMLARSDLLSGGPDPARLERVWRDLVNVPSGEVVRIFADAALAHRDPAVAVAVQKFLLRKVEFGELPPAVLTLMISAEAALRMSPALAQGLEALLVPGTAPEALTAGILALAEQHRGWISSDALVEHAFFELHRREVADRVPLDEVGPITHGRTPPATVRVGRVELPVDQRPDRDLEAIPTAASTALVMCPATKEVVERAAHLYFAGIPFILEGSPGTAKSTVPAYLARLSQTPFRSFPCTPETTAEELIGRYVGGLPAEERTPLEVMERESTNKLAMRLNGFDVEIDPAWDRARMIREISEIEAKPRWVNGPLLRAMVDGETLLLDEYDLLPNALKVRLNAIRDEKGFFTVQEHSGRKVQVDPHFRLVCAQNGATADRPQVEASNLSRFQVVHTRPYEVEDFLKILEVKYGEALSPAIRIPLARTHAAIAQLAEKGQLDRANGGITFGPRDLLKTAKRVDALSGRGLPDKDLLRREMQEIYRDVLRDPRDQQVVNDLLDLHVPSSGRDLYADLKFQEDEHTWRIGDVEGTKREGDPPFVPELSRSRVESKRLLEMEYRYRKALAMGENVLLVGGPASGKTHLVVQGAKDDRQPYFSMTGGPEVETSLFVGSYQERGWQPGLVERCAKERGLLALHEVNACDPRVLEVINSTLDDRRMIFVPKDRGHSLRLPADMRIVATMNDVGQGFGGRGILSRPFRNRFTMVRVPDLKDPAEYLSLTNAAAQDFGVDPRLTQAVVDLHLAVLTHYGERRDRPALTFRTIENCLELIGAICAAGKTAPEAYLLAATDIYADVKGVEDRAKILELIPEAAK